MSRQIVDIWTQHLKQVKALQDTALQLLAHPDVTPEQLVAVHRTMVSVMQQHREIVPKVRAKWSRFSNFIDLENVI